MSRNYPRGAARAQPLTIDEHAGLQEQVQQGAIATQLSEFAEQKLLVDQERRIRRAIFAMIDSPEGLQSGKAVQAWIELRSAHRLVEQLRKLGTAGKAAHLAIEGAPAQAD